MTRHRVCAVRGRGDGAVTSLASAFPSSGWRSGGLMCVATAGSAPAWSAAPGARSSRPGHSTAAPPVPVSTLRAHARAAQPGPGTGRPLLWNALGLPHTPHSAPCWARPGWSLQELPPRPVPAPHSPQHPLLGKAGAEVAASPPRPVLPLRSPQHPLLGQTGARAAGSSPMASARSP